MRVPTAWTAPVLVAAGALTACGGSEGAAADPDQPVLLLGIVSLEIGAAEGADEYLFGRIAGLTQNGGGRIYVADGQTNEIRAYGPDGTFLFRAARGGSGPGEVREPCCLTIGPDGRLWVRDAGNARYQSYRLDPGGAVYQSGVRMQPAAGRPWAPTTFDNAGHLIDVGDRSSPSSAPTGNPETVRFTLDSTGQVIREEIVPEPPPESVDRSIVERRGPGSLTRRYVWQPYGSLPLIAHGPRGAWASAVSGRYAVRLVAPGQPDGLLASDLAGPPLSDDERRHAREQLEASAEWVGQPVAALPFGIRDRKAPLRALWFDRGGRLWVQVTPAEGEPSRADVYDPSGVRVAVAEWPADVELRTGYVTQDLALGIRRDSLGVERVARIAWSRK
jgi:hypothetical protein